MIELGKFLISKSLNILQVMNQSILVYEFVTYLLDQTVNFPFLDQEIDFCLSFTRVIPSTESLCLP